MTTARRAILVLLTALLAWGGLSTAVGSPAAHAVPPGCEDPGDPGCEPQYVTQNATRKLTVSRSVGTVTGSLGGQPVDCGATCTATVPVSRECEVGGACEDWPAATPFGLAATGGPTGYAPSWTGCGRVDSCTGALGDESSGAALHTVTLTWVDVTAPTVTFAPPTKVGPSGGYQVVAGASDNSGSVARFDWTVDAVAQAEHSGVLALGGLSAGTHTVAVRAVDGAGNLSAPVTREVLVDSSADAAVTPLPAYARSATVPFAFTPDTDVVSVTCGVDDATPTDCASGWSGVTAATSDGQHAYRLHLVDDVGNTRDLGPFTFVVDRTAPVVGLVGPAEASVLTSGDATFRVDVADDHLAGAQCAVDGRPVVCDLGADLVIRGLAEGAHSVTVSAEDHAGNQTTLVRHFRVDLPGPGPSSFRPAVRATWKVAGAVTTFRSVTVTGLPTSASAVLTCRGSRSCPWASRTVKHRTSTVKVLQGIGRPRLRAGARLVLTLSDAGRKVTTTWTVRTNRAPKVTTRR